MQFAARLALYAFIGLSSAGCRSDTPPPMPTSPAPTHAAPATATASATQEAAVVIGGVRVPVELALTAQEQARGLSGRDRLEPGFGMLFLFREEAQYTFWMKDMRFPLDIIWISGACRVAQVSRDVPPPAAGAPDTALPVYSPTAPARYVLEVNAGEAEAGGIDVGMEAGFQGEVLEEYRCAAR